MYQSVNNVLEGLSVKVGLPIDIVKTMIIMILNMPLCSVYMVIKSPLSRQLFSLIIGLIELFFLLQFEGTYVLFASVMTFIVIQINKKYSFLASVICSTATLIVVHLHRFLYIFSKNRFDYSSWKVDCSVYMMILVTKMTYYGYSFNKMQKRQAKNKEYKEGQLTKQNYTTLSYFSYCFFFPSLHVGPTFEYETFVAFINLERQYKNIKFSLINTAKAFGQGVLLSIITAIVMPIFDHEWVIRSELYNSYPLWGKLLAINLIGFCYRAKFYAAWYLTQVTINLSGISYSENGKNDSVVCGSIMFELQPNPKNKTEYWNSSIQLWLKNIVYENIASVTKNPTLSVFGTFLVSAFWHGIYLTYYFGTFLFYDLGFVQWAILVQLTKFFYKLSFFLPKSFRNSWAAVALVYIAGSITMNYIGMAIVVLQWENMIIFYSGLHYSMTIVMVVCLLLSFVVKTPKQKKQKSHQKITPTQPKQQKQE